MKISFASYEHAAIGFPGVVLKWHFDGLAHRDPYVVVRGLMCPYCWELNQPKVYAIERELGRFDDWVRRNYGDDVTVQG